MLGKTNLAVIGSFFSSSFSLPARPGTITARRSCSTSARLITNRRLPHRPLPIHPAVAELTTTTPPPSPWPLRASPAAARWPWRAARPLWTPSSRRPPLPDRLLLPPLLRNPHSAAECAIKCPTGSTSSRWRHLFFLFRSTSSGHR